MNIEEIAFLVGLTLIPFTFIFARKQILKIKVQLYLLLISIILAVVATIQSVYYVNHEPNFYLFLFCPIYHLAIFYPSLFLFKKFKKRNPKDAPRQFFAYDDGLWSDRIFDFVLMMLWLVVPMGLLAYFYA